MKPANLFLADLNDGKTNAALTEALSALFKAVHNTGRAGSVTLTLTVKPPKNHGGSVDHFQVDPTIKEKLPKPDTGVDLYWSRRVKPRAIMLENVEEFADWGPLLPDGTPCPVRRGTTFRLWLNQLRGAGYRVEHRILRACDYGAPTTRRRLFVIARRDGLPIAWPQATHGASGSGLAPYRTAAECIDWSIPCPSIFERKRPLAENTLRRIARGVMRYVVQCQEPFLVPLTHTGYGERPGQQPRVPGLERPLGTVVAGGCKHALIAAFLAKHYGGHETPGAALDQPAGTITTQDHHALVATHLTKLRGTSTAQGVDEPLHTISAGGTHFAEVRALLLKFDGTGVGQPLAEPLQTITTRDRFGLATVRGEDYAIVDIGMRMLQPRELYRAQGFPDSYVIDFEHDGRPLPKAAQIRMVGNSVCPPIAKALVESNFAHERRWKSAA